VQENHNTAGAIYAGALLEELMFDRDPVTQLPRSGPLRDWLGDQIRSGHEVTVAFFDLDAFGEINRRGGHTEGDRSLARAADVITAKCTEFDFVCRFGGDEFAIGSLRTHAEIEEFSVTVKEQLAGAGLPATVGTSGGRRAKARADANIQATVEELLRIASMACLSNKRALS
jgi:diguanylate cyclase (GGDEF)-like protein